MFKTTTGFCKYTAKQLGQNKNREETKMAGNGYFRRIKN